MAAPPSPTGSAPLAGIRVLEMGQIISGTLAGMLMADLGADVIKIESPAGDLGRNPGIASIDGESAVFLAFNRGKRSVCLDLKKDGGRSVLLDLVRRSDVVIDNFRPGVLQRMEVDYERLAAVNPAIVCCSITGFGTSGPQAGLPSFDLVHQARSGLLSVTGPIGGPPARAGIPLGDLAAPLFALHGIMAALIARQATGRGRLVEVSMLESLTFLHTYDAVMYLNGGPLPTAWGTQHAHLVPWQAFETSDGYVVVATREERLWQNFCAAIGLPALADDPDFRTNADRVANRDRLIPLLEERMRTRSTGAWLEVLGEREVPAAPVNDLAAALAEPALTQHDAVVEVPHPRLGGLRMLANPVRLSGSELAYAGPPALGEHTADVLASVGGYDTGTIASLIDAGVIRTAGAPPPDRRDVVAEPA